MDPEKAESAFSIMVNQMLACTTCFCDSCTDFLVVLTFGEENKQQATPAEVNEYYWKCERRYYRQEIL